jgi:hypothetical protein
MPRDRHRAFVSVGTTIALLLAAATAIVLPSHHEPPPFALYSNVVFYLERFFATFVMLYAVLAVTVRTARAERARLREQVYEALRQLERVSQRGRR